MRILAFDQATRVSGWAIFQDGQYIDSGVIDLQDIRDTGERTKQMGIELCNKIAEVAPNLIIIEEVQNQNNTSTVIKLARLQGMILGFAAAHKIKTNIFEVTHWRKILSYKQGPKIGRNELKQQSIDYVKKNFGFDFPEDRCEAICIGDAACKAFEKPEEVDIEI